MKSNHYVENLILSFDYVIIIDNLKRKKEERRRYEEFGFDENDKKIPGG